MKKLFILIFFFSYISHPIMAKPGHGYLGLLSGVSFHAPEKTSNFYKSFYTGTTVGIFGGYDFNYGKLEAEISDIENPVNHLVATTNTYVTAQEWSVIFMSNAYLIPFQFKIVRPYVGGGIGYAVHSYAFHQENTPKPGDIFDFNHLRKYSNGFAYQVIGGLEFLLSPLVNLDIEYRLWGMPSISYKQMGIFNSVSTSLSENLVLIKLTYKFP
jgi:opacity protein-like surface antigen